MKGMFTMASVAVKNLPLEEQFSPDAIGRCHKARNIPCFNLLIQKEDNTSQVTIIIIIIIIVIITFILYKEIVFFLSHIYNVKL